MPRLFEDTALAVAAHILTSGPISRADAARDLGLSAATLTRLVRPLVDAGLLEDRRVGASATGMGRPTRLLEFPTHDRLFIGANITRTRVHVVLTDCRAKILHHVALPLDGVGPDVVAAAARRGILECWDVLGERVRGGAEGRICAVGVSLGGVVRDGVVEQSRFLDWTEVSLQDLLDLPEELPTPVVVNDAIALTELERWFGLGREVPDFVVATVGAGIGHGVVHGRHAVHSPLSGQGMTSHLPLYGAHGMCHLGHVGCADGVLTSPAVLGAARTGRSIASTDGSPHDLEDLVEMADAGDTVCRRTIEDFARHLAVHAVTVCGAAMVFDIVLDGEAVTLLSSEWASGFDAHIAEFRRPGAPTLRVHRRSGKFERWAQAAAVSAIIWWLEASVEHEDLGSV